ncbi:MAG: hypothetical protein C5S38_09770 [Candidatus Methanophagaceae archaeon]|nr:MAG: hypothetical protein C5S38_09770 [Methanophagales archaeon]KAF5431461.1 hypothetical protein C5S36_10575 [Methanophagales archaeon]
MSGFKVPGEVHPVIDLKISWNWIIKPIQDKKVRYFIRASGVVLLNVNPIADHFFVVHKVSQWMRKWLCHQKTFRCIDPLFVK